MQKQPLDIPVLQHPFSRLISPHLTSPFPISSRLISSHLVSSRLISSHVFLFVIFVCSSNCFHLSAHLISCRLISPFLFSSHLKSSHFQFISTLLIAYLLFLIVSAFSAYVFEFLLFSFSPQLFSAHPGCRSRSQSCLRGIMVGGHSASAPRRSATQFNAVLLYSCSCHFLPLEVGCWQMFCCSSFSRAICQKVEAIKSKVP